MISRILSTAERGPATTVNRIDAGEARIRRAAILALALALSESAKARDLDCYALADCPKARSARIHDRCKAVYERL
jgi:hypothetical protein